MKASLLILLAGALFVSHVSATQGGCAVSRQAIENELYYARQYGNVYRIDGLNRALSEVKAHCSDRSPQSERQQQIAEKRQQVKRREQQLKAARAELQAAQAAANRDLPQEARQKDFK